MNLPLSCDETMNEAITMSNYVTGEVVKDFASIFICDAKSRMVAM